MLSDGIKKGIFAIAIAVLMLTGPLFLSPVTAQTEGTVLDHWTGIQVIVPIDGMSAGTLYAEQYTAWHLVNAPGTRRPTTLTRFDMINIKGSHSK